MYKGYLTLDEGSGKMTVAGKLTLGGSAVLSGENVIAACTGTLTLNNGSSLNTCILTGPVTASTLANQTAGSGQITSINVCQTGTNSFSFKFPTNVGSVGGTSITPTGGKCSVYHLQYSGNGSRYLLLSSVTNQ